MTPYDEGRDACKQGVHRSMCPYHWKGACIPMRREWLQGYADQAKAEADEAVAEYKLES